MFNSGNHNTLNLFFVVKNRKSVTKIGLFLLIYLNLLFFCLFYQTQTIKYRNLAVTLLSYCSFLPLYLCHYANLSLFKFLFIFLYQGSIFIRFAFCQPRFAMSSTSIVHKLRHKSHQCNRIFCYWLAQHYF